jgi:hypothetical protein
MSKDRNIWVPDAPYVCHNGNCFVLRRYRDEGVINNSLEAAPINLDGTIEDNWTTVDFGSIDAEDYFDGKMIQALLERLD